ncbi:MAG: hypothetical protein ACR2HX_24695 [Pyrinomonadaceae bacterium]
MTPTTKNLDVGANTMIICSIYEVGEADGRSFIAMHHAPDGKLMAATVKGGASFEAGHPVALFDFRPGGNVRAAYYSVTADGQRFLLSTIVETKATAPLTVVINWTANLKR